MSAPDDDADGDDDPEDGQGTEPADGPVTPGESDRTRRWLIRILVGLGLGIPIAIEGATFVGLIRSRLFGGDGDDGDDGATPTATRTRTATATIPPGGVGVGDELLPATEPADTVTDAAVVPAGDGRTFSLTVRIENVGDDPYEVTLGSVWTDADERVTGVTPSSGRIQPGSTGSVTGTWDLPPDATPAAVQAIAVRFPGGETVAERVPLAPVAVREEG
jgi:hypothetical protein